MKPVAPVSAINGLCAEPEAVTGPLHGYERTLGLARHWGEFSSVSLRILPSRASVRA